MSKWIEGKVAGKRQWTERLFSLQVAAPALTFVAGQFARLALPAPPGSKEPMLGRPYSFVNPPDASAHEFYFNVLPQGPLSPRLAALEQDDSVWLLDRANGFFCATELPDAAALWCLATGTGLGPYLSILRTDEPWEKFERIVLVHAVRHAADLSYAGTIAGIALARPGRFSFVPFVSREPHKGALAGRIPRHGARYASGARAAGYAPAPAARTWAFHARDVLVEPRAWDWVPMRAAHGAEA
jgi:ferredoxin--NADP+ reductase